MNKNLIIYGIGKFAEYVAYLFKEDSEYGVVAYCIEEKLRNSDKFDGKPLVSFETVEEFYPASSYHVFIAVGNNIIRSRLYSEAKDKGYFMASYISTKAQTWQDVKTGSNVFIGEGSVIQPFVEIGNNSFLICANIGHHSRIGDHVLLSVTTLGGDVRIGNHSFLGMNSAIKHGVCVGEYSIIGMNVSIEKDAAPYSVYSNTGTSLRKIDSTKLIDRLLL